MAAVIRRAEVEQTGMGQTGRAWWVCVAARNRANTIGSQVPEWHGPNGCAGCIGGILDHPAAAHEAEAAAAGGGRVAGSAGLAQSRAGQSAACSGWEAALGLPSGRWAVGRAYGGAVEPAAAARSVAGGTEDMAEEGVRESLRTTAAEEGQRIAVSCCP